MANGYGGSSGSSSSVGASGATYSRRTVNDQGQTAPPGFRYMPDGSLMSDVEYARLYGNLSKKVITSFDLDFSDISADGERRAFSITGDNNPEFILEIKNNATGDYYNFVTEEFQTTRAYLQEIVSSGVYKGSILFPSTITTDTVNGAVSSATSVTMDSAVATKMAVGDRVTGNAALNSANITVASIDSTNVFSLSSAQTIADGVTLSFSGDDQYDISLYAVPYSNPEESTRHADYVEVRFDDGSLDINNSTGSNSLMLRKVLYQYASVLLTLSGYSPNATVTGSGSTFTTNIDRGKSKGKIPFSFSQTSSATTAYRILKQPTPDDVLAFVEPVVGSDPIDLPGEDIYPTARAAFTGDDVNGAVTSGSVVRMDNTDLSAAIAVGDKITSPTTTGTVNGAIAEGRNVVIDEVVANIMAVGDSITGPGCPFCNEKPEHEACVVSAINTGSDVNTFTMGTTGGHATAWVDNASLTFSSKVNRELTTVTVVETSGTATDFTMSQAIQFRDDQPLTFTPRMNYAWPVDNLLGIGPGMISTASDNVTSGSVIANYEDSIVQFAGTTEEKKIVKYTQKAVDTLGKKPTIVNGLVTVQEGMIVFNKQQVLALAGDTLKLGGYGESEIFRVYGWDVKFTDLKVALTPRTTTTSSVVSNSTTIGVADREGVINNISRLSGIGINAKLGNPLITAGGGADGAGNFTVDSAQTLENGATLTIENTGTVATISGNIEVIKAGTSDRTLRFDVEKILSNSA